MYKFLELDCFMLIFYKLINYEISIDNDFLKPLLTALQSSLI